MIVAPHEHSTVTPGVSLHLLRWCHVLSQLDSSALGPHSLANMPAAPPLCPLPVGFEAVLPSLGMPLPTITGLLMTRLWSNASVTSF